MNLPRWLRKFLDALPRQDDGLIKPGNWRAVYPDGNRSRGVRLNEAESLVERFGGHVEWIDRKRTSRYLNGWICAGCGTDNPDEDSPCATRLRCEACGRRRPS